MEGGVTTLYKTRLFKLEYMIRRASKLVGNRRNAQALRKFAGLTLKLP